MYVVATAGHVDHGKSTLVRALTRMEPDRWEEEKRRGLTIDLGFAWTGLPSGADVAFVDVPGHERFLSNMLAGVGPAPVVMFIVAADEGWMAQSADHLDALAALGTSRGIIVLTRADRADEKRRSEVAAQVRSQVSATPLADAPVVTVSAHTGEGLEELRVTLDEVLGAAPAPDAGTRVRLWVDRAFSVKGAGTVVTGTLSAGSISVGDELCIGQRTVEVRGIQSENRDQDSVGPVRRVALNLRGVGVDEVGRGSALLSPDAWRSAAVMDVRRRTGDALDGGGQYLVAHVGTAETEVHVRPLGPDFARLNLNNALPLELGDRLILRAPGASRVVAGVEVIDLDPPELNRRGAAARRAVELAEVVDVRDPLRVLRGRGYADTTDLAKAGFELSERPAGVIAYQRWWIAASQVATWKKKLLAAVEDHLQRQPLSQGLPQAAAQQALGVEAPALLDLAVAAAKLEKSEGRIRPVGRPVDLGPAEGPVRELEKRLREQPFQAPEAKELSAAGLGDTQLAAAAKAGRILRLPGGVVLLPTAPKNAQTRLSRLEQPFSASEARKALGTTRRVAIPLLEHMDHEGLTVQVEGSLRRVR